ncbi:UPF0187-domain-containing protein [Meredithblackwellia eburnea MCA 4105]
MTSSAAPESHLPLPRTPSSSPINAQPHGEHSGRQSPILQSRSSSIFVHPSATSTRPRKHQRWFLPAKGVVIYRIWPAVLLHTFAAALVTVLYEFTWVNLSIPNVMMTVLGLVVGFGISYRASQGFDRFNVGRARWTDMIKASRTLGRYCWAHVPEKIDSSEPSPSEIERARTEKKRFMGLILAYCISVKHALRGEEGVYWEDLYDLVSWLPQFQLKEESGTTHRESPLCTVPPVKRRPSAQVGPAANSTMFATQIPSPIQILPTIVHISAPCTLYGAISSDYSPSSPLLSTPNDSTLEQPLNPKGESGVQHNLIIGYASFSRLLSLFRKPSSKAPSGCASSKSQTRKEGWAVDKWHPTLVHSSRRIDAGELVNTPLVILGEMSRFVACLERRGFTSGAITGGMYSCLTSFEDSLGVMEQILTTPLPFVYSVHLRQEVWVYLLLLPAQLVGILHWLSIPMVGIVSFLFLGFLAAGEELSQPFGWDENDIDLDLLCSHIIGADLREIMSGAPPPLNGSKEWTASDLPPI